MGRKIKVRPGINTYAGAVAGFALRHAVQAKHTGMDDTLLAARLAVAYPDLPATEIVDLITQAKFAIEGAYQLQSQLYIVETPIIDSWGFDPVQEDEWRIQAVLYVEAPSSWWTRLIELSGRFLPTPLSYTEFVSQYQSFVGGPGMGDPYPENISGIGLRDDIPDHATINATQLTRLSNQAAANAAPGWFQAAWNAANAAGASIAGYGSKFATAITGVFRKMRGD